MSTRPCRVSVVLPTFNRARQLSRSIGSVMSQTMADLELIVIDDGSTDDTIEVVRAMQDGRLRYERLPRNAGVGAARNRGIELARCEWVAFQDSDDQWLPEKLERQLASIASAPNAVLVVTNTTPLRGYSRAPQAPRADGRLRDITEAVVEWLPGAPTWLVRRDALVAAGGFATQLQCYEDWDLALRLSGSGRVLLMNEALVRVERAPGSLFHDDAGRWRALRDVVLRNRGLIERQPRAWTYYCNAVGQGEARFGSMHEARRWFARALRASPFSARGWANVGASLWGRTAFNKYVEASRSLRRASMRGE